MDTPPVSILAEQGKIAYKLQYDTYTLERPEQYRQKISSL